MIFEEEQQKQNLMLQLEKTLGEVQHQEVMFGDNEQEQQ